MAQHHGEYWRLPDPYTVENSPGLMEFFNHSDCDGEISPEMCAKVANELEALLLPDEPASGHLERLGYKRTLQRFIDGCRAAAEVNKPLLFH